MAISGAEVQIENGNFTRIHNAILEEIALGKFNVSEYKCLLVLLRKTYGYQKKEDAISLNQWAEGTGINKRHVKPVLDRLIERKVILCQKGSAGRGHTAVYGFNKYFEQWEEKVRTDVPIKKVRTDVPINKEKVRVDVPEKVRVDVPTKERKKAAAAADVPEPMPQRNPFVAAYERYIGVVESPIAAERIADWEKRISLGAWQYAVKEAHDNNGRNWKYLTAILQRVEREGAPVQDAVQDSKPTAPEYGYISDPLTGEKKRVQL